MWFAGIAGSVAMSGFLLAWRVQEIRAKERHDTRSLFQQEIVSIHEKIDLIQDSYDVRMKALEASNVGTIVTLEHIEKFQNEVNRRFNDLDTKRQEDMQRIHLRLDAVHNAARLVVSKDRETHGRR